MENKTAVIRTFATNSEESSMQDLKLQISGMSCGHCVSRVTNAIKQVAGVASEQVEIGSATVVYDPSKTSSAEIINAIVDSGYDAQPSDSAPSAGRPA